MLPQSRYHNFITHRAFVLKLSILQYFNWNNVFSLNFCYIVFCCARNCILWYMNHIYDSIQRIFWNHLTYRFYDFFQKAMEGLSLTILSNLFMADRFSFAALLICCKAMHRQPNCSFSSAVSCSL